MAMTLRLPPEVEDQLRQVAETEHRSVQQTVLVAIEEYLSVRETAEILADAAALRGLAEARESEQAGDVGYGVEAARALLAQRKRCPPTRTNSGCPVRRGGPSQNCCPSMSRPRRLSSSRALSW